MTRLVFVDVETTGLSPHRHDVWEIARRGDVMPQKSTFFYPKLTSGLLMLPL